jgi:16S rRNA (adenine1518-N6/adenine1519-N6)-dimethyltransferase
MTGQEVRETLARTGVLPSKQLGQNFLVDPNMARWIISQLDAKPDDTIVEVGPGTGSLTEHLVGTVRKIILIEFDARLAADLTARFAGDPSVEVHHADGARFDRRFLFSERPIKFLGNLPYSSGGAILRNMLTRPHPFDRAVIMLQKEVIERLAAKPGTKDYGILSLTMQVDWDVKPQRTVPPEAFHPRPTIDSSVAVLVPRTNAFPPFDHRLFDELIRRGFSQRRKQLRKQLPDTADWPAIAQELGVPETARAEELTLDQWVTLARACDVHPLKDLPQKDGEIFDIVDADDQVTGQATRREVHTQGLMHRAVHVFVFNKRGDLLLQQRSHLKDVHPGVWDSSVAGHLDAGENYATAAIRELEEEMSITATEAPEEIARITACKDTGWEHVRVYRTTHHGSIRFPAAEVESALWFPLSVIEAWLARAPNDFAPGFQRCWKEFHAHQKNPA